MQFSQITGLFFFLRAYPELAAIVGATLPNYQGMFLRGYGSQAHSQNNGGLIGTTSTTHASGGLGVVQGDASRNIYGSLDGYGVGRGSGPYRSATTTGAFSYSAGSNRGSDGEDYSTRFYIDTSRIVPTASENRPINVAIHYLIKAN